MRKISCTILFSLCLLLTKAQQGTMFVHQGGSTISYATEQIDSIKVTVISDSIGLYKNNTVIAKHYINDIDSITFQKSDVDLSCPGIPTVTDIDGNVYHTVKIGAQCWLKENLKVTKYSDGTAIAGRTAGAVAGTDIPMYYYDEVHTTATLDSKYGFLYNWAATVRVNNCENNENFSTADRQGICPTGWHVPNDAEWATLITTLGGEAVAGGDMKTTDYYWYPPNAGATNSSGFSASPAGSYYGGFDGVTFDADFWSSTQKSVNEANIKVLGFNIANIMLSYDYKYVGLSVRCIKD